MEIKTEEERVSNDIYYNNLLLESRKRAEKRNRTSFGSQKVELSDYLLSPKGYESVVYTFYFISIPYVLGALFLFVVIARLSFSNFMLLNFNSFFIVWAIGYEIIASILLIVIFMAFLKYNED